MYLKLDILLITLLLVRFLNQRTCLLSRYLLRGQGGPRPKIILNVIFVEGRQSYQMLFTGSKNIDPKKHTITLRPRALLAIISKF